MMSRPPTTATVMQGSVEVAVGGTVWQRVVIFSSVPLVSRCQRNTLFKGADGGTMLREMLSVRWNRFEGEKVPDAAPLRSVVTVSPKHASGQTVPTGDSARLDTNPGRFVGTPY